MDKKQAFENNSAFCFISFCWISPRIKFLSGFSNILALSYLSLGFPWNLEFLCITISRPGFHLQQFKHVLHISNDLPNKLCVLPSRVSVFSFDVEKFSRKSTSRWKKKMVEKSRSGLRAAHGTSHEHIFLQSDFTHQAHNSLNGIHFSMLETLKTDE